MDWHGQATGNHTDKKKNHETVTRDSGSVNNQHICVFFLDLFWIFEYHSHTNTYDNFCMSIHTLNFYMLWIIFKITIYNNQNIWFIGNGKWEFFTCSLLMQRHRKKQQQGSMDKVAFWFNMYRLKPWSISVPQDPSKMRTDNTSGNTFGVKVRGKNDEWENMIAKIDYFSSGNLWDLYFVLFYFKPNWFFFSIKP